MLVQLQIQIYIYLNLKLNVDTREHDHPHLSQYFERSNMALDIINLYWKWLVDGKTPTDSCM